VAYAEWQGHLHFALRDAQTASSNFQAVLIGLEEMYWDTGDEHYRRFAHLCHYQAWCPLFDREADLFAATFADIVRVSYAITTGELWGKDLLKTCHEQGLSALTKPSVDCTALHLRLQTVWMEAADQTQTAITR
jgi:hypothetical protein